jgi:hypothetical protein
MTVVVSETVVGSWASLVEIHGGTLEMNSGSKICDSKFTQGFTTEVPSRGAAVYLASGNFTMNAGEISGNSAPNLHTSVAIGFGGGVCVEHGSFMMYSGKISGNEAAYGGGVHVGSGGIFSMAGGEISDNSVYKRAEGFNFEDDYGMQDSGRGGGVNIENGGKFERVGGTIKGNAAGGDVNTPISGGYGGFGGGVAFSGNGWLSIYKNALIYGDDNGHFKNNANGAGELEDPPRHHGYAVYAWHNEMTYYRNSTINKGERVNLGLSGDWEGEGFSR